MQNLDSVKSIKQQIHLFLDNELPNDEQQNLIQYMENDPRSNKIFNKEKDFREFLKTNVRRSDVSPDFIQSLKERIKM